MRTSLQVLADQQKVIEAQNRRIAALSDTVGFIADVAGLSNHPRVTAALGRVAADENPASTGWATTDSGSEAPAETTQQAAQPSQGTDSPTSAGEAPNTDVTPDATTSVDSTDTVLDAPLDLNEQDVTAPVAGTDDLGEGARGQAGSGQTQTDVQVGNPNNPDAAFTETGWTNTSAKAPGESRTIASLRLARLRMQAGIESADSDDLTLGTTIAASAVTDEAIQSEIATLAKVITARKSATAATQSTATRHLVPRSASGVQRTVPSFVEPQAPMQTVASGPDDAEFLFE